MSVIHSTNSISDKVKIQYELIKSRLINEQKANVIAQHLGVISQDLINSLADTIEDILLSYGEDKTKIKRVFSIFIEGCRNIRSHGSIDENTRQSAFFIVARAQGAYQFYFSNLIVNEDIDGVKHYVRTINNSNLDEIKAMHQASLLNYVQNQKDGSGSGLLIMRLRSYNHIDVNIYDLNEQLSLIVVRVDVLN